MSASLEDLDKLPGSVKLGAAGAGGAGIAAVFLKYLGNPVVLTIIVVGTVLVILLLLLWGRFIKWKQSGKAKVFGEGLGAQLRATPQQVTDADSRAKLDDLRRKLQEGIEKMNATGKGVYVLPWYLMVGEPGSGKTKAVAAAGIALPGFQDPLQGAGGTVNMNWWFTNSGVILDTAGRLMLPEVATSHNPEWDEFLRTLARRRPNCPINGLVLTIPADTLLTDEASEIERKAGEIAFQFNKVQSVLGIRFPVFVLVTKCDKILGFREFFESLNQPDQQAQMMGWSKPGSLDDPFRPDQVDQHLQKVHEQLVRRRLSLIQDPVHTEVAEGRRLDQVDALYELPDGLLSIGPRLRRYLEPIFIAGPLSSKPLFLRGIYFTSSLQTGEALDKAMSEIMGRDIAAEHGGPIVSAKPYFLRDLFQDKVFVEQGLVTRTSNVGQYKRRRKRNLLLAGCAGALVLMGFTWLGNKQLEDRISKPQHYWDELGKSSLPLISSDSISGLNKYTGGRKFAGGGTSADVHAAAPVEVTRPITIPFIYRPVAKVTADLDGARRDAYASYFRKQVLQPLVTAAGNRMRNADPQKWSATETDALYHLMLLEKKPDKLDASDDPLSRPLVPLARFALSADEERQAFERDQDKWDATLKWLYSSAPSGGGATWPPPLTSNISAVNDGINRFLQHVRISNATASESLKACDRVAECLAALETFEATWEKSNLSERRQEWDADGGGGAHPVVSQWKKDWLGFTKEKQELDVELDSLHRHGWEVAEPLDQFYARTVRETTDQTLAEAKRLQSVVPPNASKEAQGKLADLIAAAKAQQSQLAETTTLKHLKALQNAYLSPAPQVPDMPAARRYERHYQLLKIADGTVTLAESPEPGINLVTAEQQLTKLDAATTTALRQSRTLVGESPEGTREFNLNRWAAAIVDIGSRRSRFLIVDAALNDAPAAPDAWNEIVAASASSSGWKATAVRLPLTALDGATPQRQLRPEFDPGSVSDFARRWAFLAAYVEGHEPMGKAALKQKLNLKNAHWDNFGKKYTDYWQRVVPEQAQVRSDLGWAQFQAELDKMVVADVARSLDELRRMQAAAVPNIAVPKPPDTAFLRACDECRKLWVAFRTVEEARATLLGMTDARRTAQYLFAAGGNKTDYWPAVFTAALNALAEEADKAAKVAAADLKNFQKFPLAPPRGREELTFNDILEVQKRLRKLTAPLVADRDGAVAAARTGAPAPLPDPDVAAALSKLEGREALKGDPIAEAVVARADLVNALAAGKLRCNVMFTRAAQDTMGGPFVWVTLCRAGVPLAKTKFPGCSLRDPTGDAPAGGVELDNAGGTIDLGLAEQTGANRYSQVVTIAGGAWPCLRLVVADQGDRKVVQDKDSWLVTYVKPGPVAQGKTITLKIKFVTDKPDLIPVKLWNGERVDPR